jgi:hypothetical protein
MLLLGDSEPWNHAIGIDPGETTGLCAIRLVAGSVFSHRLRGATVLRGQVGAGSSRALGSGTPWWFREARTVRSIAGRIFSVAERWGVLECCHLAIEDFILREDTTDRNLLSPVRVTSGLLALFEEMEGINIVPHFNPSGKVGVPDPALKKLGFYEPGQPHSNDAARQAILVLRKMSEGKIPFGIQI